MIRNWLESTIGNDFVMRQGSMGEASSWSLWIQWYNVDIFDGGQTSKLIWIFLEKGKIKSIYLVISIYWWYLMEG
jgi:hypothetical protein